MVLFQRPPCEPCMSLSISHGSPDAPLRGTEDVQDRSDVPQHASLAVLGSGSSGSPSLGGPATRGTPSAAGAPPGGAPVCARHRRPSVGEGSPLGPCMRSRSIVQRGEGFGSDCRVCLIPAGSAVKPWERGVLAPATGQWASSSRAFPMPRGPGGARMSTSSILLRFDGRRLSPWVFTARQAVGPTVTSIRTVPLSDRDRPHADTAHAFR